jgi:hypothetical protein
VNHLKPQSVFETAKDGVTYKAIVTGDRHLVLQEASADGTRSYRISGRLLDGIRRAEDPFMAAKDVYHQARLKRKARRNRATGGIEDGEYNQFVPIAQSAN